MLTSNTGIKHLFRVLSRHMTRQAYGFFVYVYKEPQQRTRMVFVTSHLVPVWGLIFFFKGTIRPLPSVSSLKATNQSKVNHGHLCDLVKLLPKIVMCSLLMNSLTVCLLPARYLDYIQCWQPSVSNPHPKIIFTSVPKSLDHDEMSCSHGDDAFSFFFVKWPSDVARALILREEKKCSLGLKH